MNEKKSFIPIIIISVLVVSIIVLVLIVRAGNRDSVVDTSFVSSDNSALLTEPESEVTESVIVVPPIGRARLEELGFTCKAMTHLEKIEVFESESNVERWSDVEGRRLLKELGVENHKTLDCLHKNPDYGLDVMVRAYVEATNRPVFECICAVDIDTCQIVSKYGADTSIIIGSYIYNLSNPEAMEYFESILKDEGVEYAVYNRPPELSCDDEDFEGTWWYT